jgi:superfamily II DNA/RNA helicase
MIELRKCCIHPWLLKGAEDQILDDLNARSYEAQSDALVQSSGKMVLIDKLLKKLKKGDHKVLIFSQMTRCLDLIQDYLRAQSWNFERIDGGVRGDQRQASIDRFSAVGSDSFGNRFFNCIVFLLCTRAGGVGINLTAADTCIIFDSDWNPQNDLQAQSRCHRIGQKKVVKIYRLITKNTYEREMFDRASMKLGLDKALLQRMDTSESSADYIPNSQKSAASSLSKTEIEDLLKKGAYGAFMDDESSKKFCEEDIDQILERRTLVIRHDNTAEKGSVFAKATFQSDQSHNVDVNDPDFWDKVAKQAELDIVEEDPFIDHLIIDAPRNRKQRLNYTSGQPETDEDSGSPAKSIGRLSDLKPWTITERTKLERCIMTHGYGNWPKYQEAVPRRSILHLQSVARWIITYAILKSSLSDSDSAVDAKKQLSMYTMPNGSEDITLDPGFFPLHLDNVEPEFLQMVEADMPFPGCDDLEVLNLI